MIHLVPLFLLVLSSAGGAAVVSHTRPGLEMVPPVASLEAGFLPGTEITPGAQLAPMSHVPRVDVGGLSPPLLGALVGGGTGLGAGLLFVHEACNDDPCSTFAYVLGAATGAAALGLSGALIGSRARLPQPARRNAWIGTAIGGVVGAAGGIALMAATCDEGDCGPAGYVSFPFATAGVLAGIGGFIGSLFGR